jgi:hypothetical protein
VQQDSSEQIGGAVPAQRTEASAPAARPPEPDETVILPAFVTGKKERTPKPAEPVRHQAEPEGRLPPSERGMLIFVAALLGIGTLAIVVVIGLGGFSSPPASTHTPSVAAVTPPAVESTSPSPTPIASSAAPPSPAPATTPAVRRTTPGPVVLGTLTRTDPAAFCTFRKAGRALRLDDGRWFCSGSRDRPPFPFAPNDVCRWRFIDNTAYAVAGDPTDPATWRCFT